MKKLPLEIDSCGHCPFRIVYQVDNEQQRYQDYCRLTGNKVNCFAQRIPVFCPLEEVEE